MALFRFIYALYLRLAGLVFLTTAILVAALQFLEANPEHVPQVVEILGSVSFLPPVDLGSLAAPTIEPAVLVASGALGLLFLIPGLEPWGFRQPYRPLEMLWAVFHAAAAWLFPLVVPQLLLALFVMGFISGETMAVAQPIQPLWVFAFPTALMALLVLPNLSFRRAGRADPRDPARAIPVQERRPVPLPTSGPSVMGGILGIFGIVDRLVMRIFGLALCGAAYMTFVLMQRGSGAAAAPAPTEAAPTAVPSEEGLLDGIVVPDLIPTDTTVSIEPLLWGNEPIHMVFAYGAAGVILTLPFVTPRFLTTPRNLIYGLVKAAILAGLAFVLLPVLEVATIMFADLVAQYATPLEVTQYFQLMTAVGIGAAILASLLRQFGAMPRVDYKGDKVTTLSTRQLNALRRARMG